LHGGEWVRFGGNHPAQGMGLATKIGRTQGDWLGGVTGDAWGCAGERGGKRSPISKGAILRLGAGGNNYIDQGVHKEFVQEGGVGCRGQFLTRGKFEDTRVCLWGKGGGNSNKRC